MFSSCLQTYNMLYCVPKMVHRCSNGVAVEATNDCLLLNTALVLATPTAQKIFAISSSRDKKLLPQFRKIVCLVCAPLAQKEKLWHLKQKKL